MKDNHLLCSFEGVEGQSQDWAWGVSLEHIRVQLAVERFNTFLDFLVARAEGIHLFPSRTQSLSLPAVMVLLQLAVGE